MHLPVGVRARHLSSFFVVLSLVGACADPEFDDPDLDPGKADGFPGLKLSPAAAERLLDDADRFIASAEETAVDSLQEVLCALGDGASAGSGILAQIDGVAVKGSFNLASLLSAGKSPVGVSAGVEVVYWFPPGQDVIERHVFVIPQLDASTSPGVGSFETGVIFGCDGDPGNYSGYFGSLGVAGAALNLGLDFGPLFDRYFVSQLPSNVPGANDNEAIDFAGVRGLFAGAGERMRRFAAPRRNAPYQVAVVEDILREVRYDFVLNSGRWDTELNFLYRRGLLVANYQFSQGTSSIAEELLEEAASYSIQPGESRADYSLRLPSALPRYSLVMDTFWGTDDSSTLEKPGGLLQELMSVSGHSTSTHRTLYQVAFDTTIRGTDGPGLASVTADTREQMQATMLTSATYGCARQRQRYPANRWFRVYVNDLPYAFDCIGFGPGESWVSGVSERLYREESFTRSIAPELRAIESFIDDVETYRYAVGKGVLIVHDAFHTQKNALGLHVGGIQTPDASDALTGCNSVTLNQEGLLNAARIGAGALTDGARSLGGGISTAGITSALSSAAASASVSAGLSYYYPAPTFGGSTPTSEGWPLVRSVRQLKNITCGQ